MTVRPRYTPCPHTGCPALRDRATGDCPNGHARAKRLAAQARTNKARPSARAQGYDKQHETQFRAVVLARDPICVVCRTRPSRHADHHPHTRTQLVRIGLNPNDPRWGRGLCASCHSRHTATHDGGYGNHPHA